MHVSGIDMERQGGRVGGRQGWQGKGVEGGKWGWGLPAAVGHPMVFPFFFLVDLKCQKAISDGWKEHDGGWG